MSTFSASPHFLGRFDSRLDSPFEQSTLKFPPLGDDGILALIEHLTMGSDPRKVLHFHEIPGVLFEQIDQIFIDFDGDGLPCNDQPP